MAMSTRVHLQTGEVLFRQGESGGDAFILVHGRIQISRVADGAEQVINELGPGEMLGELAIIDGGPRTATATALEQSELARVTETQIAERVSRADPVLGLLLRQVITYLRRQINGYSAPAQPVAPATLQRMRLEGELGSAVERQQLELWYQPIVDLVERRVAGFEALVSWRHPVHGLVPPSDFIPLAEESGLVVQIGAWVMSQGVQTLLEIDRTLNDGQPRFMSVNVSGRQLDASGFVDEVVSAAGGLERRRLHLEMTEGVLIKSSAASDTLRRCKDLGVGLYLDDFGTGYSSLAYLTQLPFDAIKIDHSFAKKMEEPDDGDGMKLIRAIVGMATTLGREVIMEGVETPRQRDVFRSMGGRLAQGWLFGRAMPLPALFNLLAREGDLRWD
jgi:EAL domain-containing protein (putative c-di-GMP-specific phosphodiesterase class I)